MRRFDILFVVNPKKKLNKLSTSQWIDAPWRLCDGTAFVWITTQSSTTLWRHQMETFSALLALCAGKSPVTGEFPSQSPVMFSLICAWINGWINNHEAGDLRRHRAHYDVTVVKPPKWSICTLNKQEVSFYVSSSFGWFKVPFYAFDTK